MDINEFWAEQYNQYVTERRLVRLVYGETSNTYLIQNYMVKCINERKKRHYFDMNDLYSELSREYKVISHKLCNTKPTLRDRKEIAEQILLHNLLNEIERTELCTG